MRRLWWSVLFLVVAGLIGLGALLAYGPISDAIVISQASPTMVALADEAGMSRKGELVFLRTDPKLVSDRQMESVCASNTAANNSNGFIEQGCFVPSTDRIYIREMPANLYDLEVSTAAYEMLHPVYINLCKDVSSCAPLNHAIEENFTAINSSSLNAQVANFAKTEPGDRDLELFSLLGTGYTKLTDDLSAYYAPYFTNITETVTANNRVLSLFQNDQSQLAQLQSTVTHDNNLATSAYQTSVYWAHAGSAHEDNYYYGLYKQYVSQENTVIDQYNELLQSYNALVTEYDGSQPVQQIQPAQTQSQ